jgi:hypothetical protein
MQKNDKILEGIIQQAVSRGYFAIDEYSGVRLTAQQFKDLGQNLTKKGIPIYSYQKDKSLNKTLALDIINSLRKGVVPSTNLKYFTVSREDLLSKVNKNLKEVAYDKSIVRFINADLGQGKTHLLYLLRGFAFEQGFAVSLVTLSQQESPLHKFLEVYHKIMWGIRTKEQPDRPALDNILDGWLNLMRNKSPDQVKRLIQFVPDEVKNVLIAYHNVTNPISPNRYDQQKILGFLSGKKIYVSDLKRMGIDLRIEENNALFMLGIMARLFRHLGFKGIVVLFDEAEAIHSLSYYRHQEKAYKNLLQIIDQSRQFPSCYFVYSTTPSFFDNYFSFWPHNQKINVNDIYELAPLTKDELHDLAKKILAIYCIAYSWNPSSKFESFLNRISDIGSSQRVGDFVKSVVSFLDEKRDGYRR